jgi:hypothetical protein
VAPDSRGLSQLDRELAQLLAQALVNDYVQSEERQAKTKLNMSMPRCYSSADDVERRSENLAPPWTRSSGASKERGRDADDRRTARGQGASDPGVDRSFDQAPRQDAADPDNPATVPTQSIRVAGGTTE